MGYIGAGISRFNTADSLTVTGDVTASGTVLPTGDTAAGDAAAVGFTSAEGLILTGQGSTSDITLKNDADATVFTVPTGTDDILFPDSAKILMGAGSDLQIYHDGSNSFIDDAGTGNVFLRGSSQVIIGNMTGEQAAVFNDNGAVTINYDNAQKLATTNTGVDVTGTAVVDGLTCSGTTTIEGTSTFGTSSADTRFNFDGPNQYRAVFKSSGTIGGQIGAAGADDLRFSNAAGSTVASIKDGNLLVGKTASNIATGGIELRANNDVLITKDGATALYLNRKSSDGEIIEFRKDGANAGEIGVVNGNNLIISNNADNSGLQLGSGSITPAYDGAGQDNSVDLGSSSTRFKDGYFSGQVLAQFFTGVGDTDTYMDISSNPANTIKFFTGGSEKARFASDGNLYIAKTSDTATGVGLTLGGGGFIRAVRNEICGVFNRQGSDGTLLSFLRSNSGVGAISVTTSATTYNTSSDRRLKSNIEDAASASDKIDAIQVRQFDWNADGSHQDYGLIAQELQPIEPMAVTGDADSDEMMGVDYSKLVPMLIKEIQELRSRVATLEAN